MAYVRKKKARGKTVYQLVEGRREGAKVKQRVLAHLGPHKTPEKALRHWSGRMLRLRHVARDVREEAEGSPFVRSLRNALRGRDFGGRPFGPEEVERRREEALRFMDERGNMRRREGYRPFELRDAYETLDASWRVVHDQERFAAYNKKNQYEYWQKIDHAQRLEREASELEERYVNLTKALGDDPEKARHTLRDRFEKLLAGHRHRSLRRRARLCAFEYARDLGVGGMAAEGVNPKGYAQNAVRFALYRTFEDHVHAWLPALGGTAWADGPTKEDALADLAEVVRLTVSFRAEARKEIPTEEATKESTDATLASMKAGGFSLPSRV